MTFRIRLATHEDVPQLGAMCAELWPDADAEEHARDLASIVAGRAPGTLPATVFVAIDAERAVGFVQVGLRSHADGCDPKQAVGFIEGWFVRPEWRLRGVGAKLVAAAEEWARGQGCVEMASDTWWIMRSRRGRTRLWGMRSSTGV